MTKKDSENWKKRKDMESAGFDIKPNRGLMIHSQNTARHEFVKFCLCFALDEKGREWSTEVQCDTGRVDVYDAGPVDGNPVVYEVETGVTPKQRKKKQNQYVIGPVRDIIVIDPADVPRDFEDAIEYLKTYEIIG